MKKITTFFCLFFSIFLLSQVKFQAVDYGTKNPVADAEVYSLEGALLGKTDADGFFSLKNTGLIIIRAKNYNDVFGDITQDGQVVYLNRNTSAYSSPNEVNTRNLEQHVSISSSKQEFYQTLEQSQTLTDKQLAWLLWFREGKLRAGKFDLDLVDFFKYTDYEGFRFQVGGQTNEKLSKNFSLRAYGAWATKDLNFKGGGGIDFFVNKKNNGKLSLTAESDVSPAGGEDYKPILLENRLLQEVRNVYNHTYFSYRQAKIAYSQEVMPHFTAEISTDYQTQRNNFLYSFDNQYPYHWFQDFRTSIMLGFNPSKYIQTSAGKILLEEKFPQFFFNYSHSWKAFDADFDYHKFDLVGIFNGKSALGMSNLTLKAGFISGNAALWNLYESFGAASENGAILERFGPKSLTSLETLPAGRFFSDRYVAFFFTHNFNDIRIFGDKSLHLSWIYNGLIGGMAKQELHSDYRFTVPDKFYQETGIELNRLISRFGLGAYYRFGVYSETGFDQNFYLKLTYQFE